MIAGFIADFACTSRRFVIEVDGGTHAGDGARDERRTAVLEAHGHRVVRFTDAEVAMNLNAVLQAIAAATTALPTGEKEK